ncbi:TonB-dependent receptor domain-containing protein [Pseudoduganella umbonata]|uniref:Outer membrane receptor protein involved in Fe transport n=1 Tax=Pseudoduganella umbonata TaxID=864828 RepID=A0A4P8HYJ0_9BURK|nr:TonB-dependent receptor [Pseudoduganella umbonata]MBB3223503.1 outer membrane receptor protein involved in Fe transport [Pseudoduganella umbonata]QCP13614.1 TonB-dependent receptor [Pseudoduganella umbonata]
MNPSKLVLRPLPALLLGALVGQLGLAHAQSAPATPSTTPPASTPVAVPAASKPATAPASVTPTVSARPADELKKPEQEAQAAGGGQMQTVTVVAERPAEQIDRSTYDVKAEVVTPNASAADVIANVPNVTVDQDGKVAIRGNQNAQIFVNGKRSAMFSGANAGDALNSYPAEALESVEVITTPGAEFGSEGGSGPILNLVTRRVRPQGSQGQVSVNVGQEGRGGTSLSGSYNDGRLQLEGQAGVMRNVNERTGWSETETDVGNAVWTTRRENDSRSPSRIVMLNPTISYNIGTTDRASATLNFNHSENETGSNEYYRTYHGGATPYEEYSRVIDRDSERTFYQLALGYERKFSATEKLNFDLRSSGNLADTDSRNRNSYVIAPPTGARPESTNGNETTNRLTEFSIDYQKRVTPMFNFKGGVKVGRSTGQSDADYFNIDPLTGEEVIDDDRASAFRNTERTYAVYVSPNLRIDEHWAVLPGLRYERVERHIDYINQDNSASDATRKLLPSLHVQYGWGERGAAITGGYSRRISRPQLSDINPNLQYVDDQNYTQGDPRLAPTRNDKYELKYTDTWLTWLNANLSVYREKDSPLLGRFLTPVPGSTAVVSEAVNFGARTNDGISINLQGRPTREVNLSGTVGFRRVQQSYLATLTNADGARYSVETERARNTPTLQLRAQYSGIPNHQLQVNGNYTGRALNGLYETDSNWQAHLSWSWRFAPQWTLRTSVRDVFDSNVNRLTQVSDTVRQVSYSEQQGRTFTVALSYSFGGVSGDPGLRNNPGMFRGPQGDGPRGPGPGGFNPGGGFGPGM